MNRQAIFSRRSWEWATPRAMLQALDAEFHFDLDPCPIGAALPADWSGRRCFVNPPYGPQIGKWLRRWHEAELAVYLLPARTDTRWFHEIVLAHAREIRFVRGRVRFGGHKHGAPFPSMIVIFSGQKQSYATAGAE